jgi:hypothetical protein
MGRCNTCEAVLAQGKSHLGFRLMLDHEKASPQLPTMHGNEVLKILDLPNDVL